MKAYFAGGCFWCVTPIYKIYGVDSVVCGYSGGDEVNPTYEDVKAQKTGHRETIELTYEPEMLPLTSYLISILPMWIHLMGRASISTRDFHTHSPSTTRQKKRGR